jgi:competence protein ComEC
LGANEELPAEFKEALRKTSTIHVVVVSGYNISVVAGFLIGLSKFIKRQYATFLGLLVIAFYTLLVGANAPAVRAAIMSSAAFFATLLGRQRFPLYFLALAALIMLLVKPTVIGDIGFQLSFLATAGIILFQNKIFQPLKLLPKPFGEDLSTTLAAQSLVVPVLFYHFGSVSAISPVVNAVSLWIIPLVTILGFVFLAVSFALPFIASFLAWILWVFLTIFVFLVEGFGKLSFAYFSFSQGIIWPALFYYAALGLAVFYLKYGRVAGRKQS